MYLTWAFFTFSSFVLKIFHFGRKAHNKFTYATCFTFIYTALPSIKDVFTVVKFFKQVHIIDYPINTLAFSSSVSGNDAKHTE